MPRAWTGLCGLRQAKWFCNGLTDASSTCVPCYSDWVLGRVKPVLRGHMTRSILIAGLLAATLAPALAPTQAFAEGVSFDKSWTTQRFSLFSSNKYGFNGNAMSIASDGSVSLAYARVKPGLWGAKAAKWSWAVSQSVPATDLAKRAATTAMHPCISCSCHRPRLRHWGPKPMCASC